MEVVFQFFNGANAWRRIVDSLSRTSDSGFYVDPSNNLDIFPVAGSTAAFTNNVFHDVVLTVAANNTVSAYLDGVLQLTTTTVMDIDASKLLSFFLDNTQGGGQGEYSPGQVGLVRLYGDVLGSAQIAAQAIDPFATLPVPEPSSLVLCGVGVLGLVGYARRRTARSRE